jgi:hypothetical protein
VLRVGHNLVYYLWVIGALLVSLVTAFAAYFLTWAARQRDILQGMVSWQDAARRSESMVLQAAQHLPEQVFVNFKDSRDKEDYERRLVEMRSRATPEEVDAQVSALAMLTSVPSEIYLRLGNYFRYRAFTTDPTYTKPKAHELLWAAIRRYDRARERAESETGRRAKEMVGQASHGIAICLLRLGSEHYGRALCHAKHAVDSLVADLSENHQPLVTYAIALMFAQRDEEAVEALKEAVSRAPVNVVANYNLACAYGRWGKSTSDNPTQTMRYRLALSALNTIVGKVGSGRATIEGIDTETDFEGIRTSAVAAEFTQIVASLKAGD